MYCRLYIIHFKNCIGSFLRLVHGGRKILPGARDYASKFKFVLWQMKGGCVYVVYSRTYGTSTVRGRLMYRRVTNQRDETDRRLASSTGFPCVVEDGEVAKPALVPPKPHESQRGSTFSLSVS
jgi:hypothetical protein